MALKLQKSVNNVIKWKLKQCTEQDRKADHQEC